MSTKKNCNSLKLHSTRCTSSNPLAHLKLISINRLIKLNDKDFWAPSSSLKRVEPIKRDLRYVPDTISNLSKYNMLDEINASDIVDLAFLRNEN